MHRLKAWAKRLLLVFVGLSAGALLIEVGLRLIGVSHEVFYRPDEFCGSSLVPNVEGWRRTEATRYIRINSDGWRDREHTKEKPPGTLRIAVLGDSYAEAFQVPLEQAFWAVMERELGSEQALAGKKVEVLNFGVSGYGTTQELLTLRHRAWAYSPDIVVLAFLTGNDFANNSRALTQVSTIPYYMYRDNQLVLDDGYLSWYRSRETWIYRAYYKALGYSRILQVIRNARYQRNVQERIQQQQAIAGEAGLNDAIYMEPVDPLWKEAWRITEGVLLLMRDEIRQRGAKFLVVTLSNAIQVHPEPSVRQEAMKQLGVTDLFYPDTRLKTLGEKEGFPVLNLAPELQAVADEKRVFLHGFGDEIGTGHWNEEGHRLAGTLIARKILQDFLAPKGKEE